MRFLTGRNVQPGEGNIHDGEGFWSTTFQFVSNEFSQTLHNKMRQYGCISQNFQNMAIPSKMKHLFIWSACSNNFVCMCRMTAFWDSNIEFMRCVCEKSVFFWTYPIWFTLIFIQNKNILSSDFCSVCLVCKPALGTGGRAEGLKSKQFLRKNDATSPAENLMPFPRAANTRIEFELGRKHCFPRPSDHQPLKDIG